MVPLADLAACFEGVIPSIIATAAADGTPNIAYLSHVAMVDDHHVAISNQYFAKTAANIRANPHATLLLVDGRSGRQYRLALIWERSLDHGPVFERMDRDLKASSAQVGMGHVMRLKSLDVFRVEDIAPCPAAAPASPPPASPPVPTLRRVAETVAHVGAQATADALVDTLLHEACAISGAGHALLAIHEPFHDRLITAGSVGYDSPGTGSEIAPGNSLIAEACAAARTLRHNDLSRVRRLTTAIAADLDSEERTRTIAVPSLDQALSQIAVPLVVQGRVPGVLFLESPVRLAFDSDCAVALETLAAQAAAVLALIEAGDGSDTAAIAGATAPAAGPVIHITSHAFDDSVFIDGRYVIKGVAGRLLLYLVKRAIEEQRTEFSNREIRLAGHLKLPEFRDNLETRLLLLRRRLDEKELPIRLRRTARGLMHLDMAGRPMIERLD